MIDILNLKLEDIVPSSLLQDKNVVAACHALTTELNDIASNTNIAILYDKLDTLPMGIIEHLAWQYHVLSLTEGWNLAETDEEKRALVKTAIAIHKLKGTKYAIRRIFEILSMDADVSEWFEYNGSPYHFKVLLKSPVEITADKLINLVKLIDDYKPVRSTLENIDLDYLILTQGSWATSYHSTEFMTVYPN